MGKNELCATLLHQPCPKHYLFKKGLAVFCKCNFEYLAKKNIGIDCINSHAPRVKFTKILD